MILTKEHKIKIGKSVSKSLTGKTGSLARGWKGTKVLYGGIHQWLRRIYGKADRCENIYCPHKCKHFEYALIKGKKHARKRNRYIMLCLSCHNKYDEKVFFGKVVSYKTFKFQL